MSTKTERVNRPIEKTDYKKILILQEHKIDLIWCKDIVPFNLILTIQEIHATLDNAFHHMYIPWIYKTIQILLIIWLEKIR
jgi:hypothetical protein